MNSLAVNSSNKSTEDLLKMWQENEMISINNMDEIEQSYQEIEETEECWIYLHFFKITDNQQRMEILHRIQEMKVEDKVIGLRLKITHQNQEGTDQIIDWIQSHLPNLSMIWVFDYLDNVDNSIHNQIIKLIDRAHLFEIAV